MRLLLGLAAAVLVGLIVGGVGYTTNEQIDEIFDTSSRDARQLALENVARFAELLASNTAVTVRPSVMDHNYSYIRAVLRDMTAKDDQLRHIAVYDADDELIEESGARAADAQSVLRANAPITSQSVAIGRVELLYSTTVVDARIREAQQRNQDRRAATIRSLLLGGAVVVGVGILLATVFGTWISRPVTRMAQAAAKLGVGDFEVRVDVAGPAEMRQLAATFNSMATDLEQSLAASIEKAALDREVATARRLQANMMPAAERIDVGDLQIASWYAPTGKMGGDWWTMDDLEPDEPTTILVGDIIGHGIPAALFTAAAKSAYRTAGLLGGASSPDRVLATIDEALRGFSEGPTMTCCALRIDTASRELCYSLGAHPPPLRFRTIGTRTVMELLDGEGPLLGDPVQRSEFSVSRQDLLPGDLIALFTDGILEATDDRERMFGLRRVGAVITDHAHRELDEILAALRRELAKYTGRRDVEDDVTVILVRYAPPEARGAS